MEKIKLLFVEDDTSFAFVVKGSLELSGIYQVETASNGKEGLEAYESFKPDVIVADIDMPVMDGKEMIAQIRKNDSTIPILFASGYTNAIHVLEGYKLDIDNFVKKPFLPEELGAHVQAILKRSRKSLNYNTIDDNIYISEFIFNTNKQFLQYKNIKKNLSLRGTKILLKLYENRGNVVIRKDILDEFWGISDFFTSRSLDVYINKLRRYLSLDSKINIETIRGKGLVLHIA